MTRLKSGVMSITVVLKTLFLECIKLGDAIMFSIQFKHLTFRI